MRRKSGKAAVLNYLNTARLSKPGLVCWAREQRCVEFFAKKLEVKPEVMACDGETKPRVFLFIDRLWCHAYRLVQPICQQMTEAASEMELLPTVSVVVDDADDDNTEDDPLKSNEKEECSVKPQEQESEKPLINIMFLCLFYVMSLFLLGIFHSENPNDLESNIPQNESDHDSLVPLANAALSKITAPQSPEKEEAHPVGAIQSSNESADRDVEKTEPLDEIPQNEDTIKAPELIGMLPIFVFD